MNLYSVIKNSALATAILATMSVSAMALKVVVVISKVSQRMSVTVDGEKKYEWLVSTGGAGYETPSGTFRPFRLEKEHFSEEWDNAPMPYSMFFTGQGHAIHGSTHISRLGTRASHGCVRLAPANAAILFGLVEKAGYKNSTFTINGGFFDFGGSSSVVESSTKIQKPFHFFWEAKPKSKAVSVLPKKKKKLKSVFASNG